MPVLAYWTLNLNNTKIFPQIHVFLSEASNPSLKQLVQNYSYDDLSKENASKAAHVIRDISCSEVHEYFSLHILSSTVDLFFLGDEGNNINLNYIKLYYIFLF